MEAKRYAFLTLALDTLQALVSVPPGKESVVSGHRASLNVVYVLFLCWDSILSNPAVDIRFTDLSALAYSMSAIYK
jgi:hypothetical protein